VLRSKLCDHLRQPVFLRFKRTEAFFTAAVRPGRREETARGALGSHGVGNGFFRVVHRYPWEPQSPCRENLRANARAREDSGQSQKIVWLFRFVSPKTWQFGPLSLTIIRHLKRCQRPQVFLVARG
jgi:hypothetical protein